MNINPRIVIIGCGAAGYSAACRLLENNYTNIIILEAENRIGGRIHSVPFGNGLVDLGAQWCHGEKDNVVYNMVKNHNLLQPSVCDYFHLTFVDSRSNFIDTNETDLIIDLLFKIGNDDEQLRAYNGSYGDYIIENFQKKLKDHPNISGARAKQILKWYNNFENHYSGCPTWFQLSAKSLPDYQECEGHLTLNWKDTGYQTIFSVLKKEISNSSKKLPIDEKILYNKSVSKIYWSDSNKLTNKEALVECSDGSQYKADHVIVTVSLGVLKHIYNNLFIPQVPIYKKNAIEGISYGWLNKIFLQFSEKWWTESYGFSFLWTDEDLEKVLLEFPEGPNKNGQSWLTTFFGFYPIDYNPNVLMIFCSGEFCNEIELLSDDVIKRGCMYLLNKFVGKKYKIPDPIDILRSSWISNSNFYGSYSYHGLKMEELSTNVDALAKPLGNDAILFAGEATHPNYFSTVHGAIETGFREANRIITHYSENTPSQVLKCNIAIVGAGMAGLGAAVTLAEAGCTDILLLEAQDKPGGRIKTIEAGEGFVDLGAQWLHGDKNALWQISQDNGLISNRTVYEGRGVFLREDGYKYNDFLVEKVNFIIGRIMEDCEEFVDSNDVPDSVGKYLEEKFGEYLKYNSISNEEIRLYLELYDWNIRFQVIDNSCDNLYNVSAKFWGRYFCPTSDGQAHINYSKGHGSVVEVLLKKLPKNILQINHPVTNINWSMKDKTVKLTCQNTTSVEADAVIVTSSLGVLKKRASKLFTPSLPTEMTDIINAMGFAGIAKIFLQFEEKWWDDEEGFQIIWNFDRPYGDDWCRYLSGFDPVHDQPRMLLGWVGGRGAELVELVNEEEIGRKCAEILRKFTKNEKISNPIQVIRSTWSTNPWILGGYSHTTPRCDNHVLLPDVLQQPLRDSHSNIRVLLAGEHTHAEHFSTTHGAYESGARQAKLLLEENIALIASQQR